MKTERRTGPAQPVASATTHTSRKAASTRETPTMTKSEVKIQKQAATRIAAMKRQLDSLTKQRDDEARAKILATAPGMPASMRRVLATAALDVVRAMVKDFLAESSKRPAEDQRRLDAMLPPHLRRTPSPGVALIGRVQTFHTLSPEQARASLRRAR